MIGLIGSIEPPPSPEHSVLVHEETDVRYSLNVASLSFFVAALHCLGVLPQIIFVPKLPWRQQPDVVARFVLPRSAFDAGAPAVAANAPRQNESAAASTTRRPVGVVLMATGTAL